MLKLKLSTTYPLCWWFGHLTSHSWPIWLSINLKLCNYCKSPSLAKSKLFYICNQICILQCHKRWNWINHLMCSKLVKLLLMLLCTYFLQVHAAYVPAKVCNEGEVCCHVQSVEVLTPSLTIQTSSQSVLEHFCSELQRILSQLWWGQYWSHISQSPFFVQVYSHCICPWLLVSWLWDLRCRLYLSCVASPLWPSCLSVICKSACQGAPFRT